MQVTADCQGEKPRWPPPIHLVTRDANAGGIGYFDPQIPHLISFTKSLDHRPVLESGDQNVICFSVKFRID